MDAHQLRILRELGERGSLAAVARALHVTPSAVSQQLAHLQRSARVPLTARSGRRLVLTPAGEALAAAAVEVAAALDRAHRAVGDHLDGPRTPVVVSAYHSAGLAWFAPLLRRVAADDGPPVRCVDQDVAHDAFPGLVADHDVVVAHRLEHGPVWPVGRVAVTPLVREPLYVAVAADHRLAGRTEVSVADVADEAWISVHDGFPLASAVEAIAALARRPLRIEHRINEFAVTGAVVASGAAVALLPGFTTPTAGGLRLLPLSDLPVHRRVDALSRPEALERASVRTVLDALRAVTAASAAGVARR